MDKKKTLVIGASSNPSRYSYLAIQRLRNAGQQVVAIGKRHAMVNDVEILTEKRKFENIDTVTLYLNPVHQQEYYDYVISLKPERIIFNPGAENAAFAKLAKENNINAINACTLVLLSINQY